MTGWSLASWPVKLGAEHAGAIWPTRKYTLVDVRQHGQTEYWLLRVSVTKGEPWPAPDEAPRGLVAAAAGGGGVTSTERLVAALEQVRAPKAMIVAARAGCYHDFESESATPIHDLVRDARAAGFHAIAQRAIEGEFEATDEESDAWAANQTGEDADVLARLAGARTLAEAIAALGLDPTEEVRQAIVGGGDLEELALRHMRRGR